MKILSTSLSVNLGLPLAFAKLDSNVQSDEVPFGQPEEREKGGKIAFPKGVPPKQGMNQDVFTLEEGDVTIQWPKALSKASYQDLEDWLELIKRKAKRAISEQSQKPVNIGDPSRYTNQGPE